jgi:hypothetical protein
MHPAVTGEIRHEDHQGRTSRLTNVGIKNDKSAHRRHQVALAFGRDRALASDWFLPVDAVAALLADTLAQSHSRIMAATLVKSFGHIVLAVIAQAGSDRPKDAPICFIDLTREADGRHAYMGCGGRDSMPEPVEGYTAERAITLNVSFLIRSVRPAAARRGLAGFREPFLPAPSTPELASIMRPYTDAMQNDIIEETGFRKHEAPVRRIGAEARSIAMGESVEVGTRKPKAA